MVYEKKVGSLVVNGHNSGLWCAFSSGSFRRRILGTIGCGVTRQEEEEEEERSEWRKKKCETKRKVEILEELSGVVKRLGSEVVEEMESAASDIRRLARTDAEARSTLAMLGAIPCLVGMLEYGGGQQSQISALYALLNLGIGNDMNKSAIVEAGAVPKMLRLVVDDDDDSVCQEAVVANFLGLSALDANKPIIGAAQGAIPFLAKTLHHHRHHGDQVKQDCLRAIYNLSIFPPNISIIVSQTDLIPYLVHALGDMDISERILSILANVVAVSQGRKAILTTSSPDALPILIDAFNWSDSPVCQEKAAYILMVMAHKGSYGDRQAMLEAGIVTSSLELTLLGTTLAQRRASRILHCFTSSTSTANVQKGKQLLADQDSINLGFIVGSGGAAGPLVSAPICVEPGSNQHQAQEEMMSEETKAVKHLVQQSLQNNMTRIVTRANLPQNFLPSQHFKFLTTKSLPF